MSHAGSFVMRELLEPAPDHREHGCNRADAALKRTARPGLRPTSGFTTVLVKPLTNVGGPVHRHVVLGTPSGHMEIDLV